MSTLRMSMERQVPPDFVTLASATSFVRGGARYRRADLEAQVGRFAEPCFVVARDGGSVIGGCALDKRRLRMDGRAVIGAYRALLCVRAGREGEGIGQRIVAAALSEIDRLAHDGGEPVLSYGCVDSANVAAQRALASRGVEPIGSLSARLLYRQWPRQRVALEPVEPATLAAVEGLRQAANADCATRDETPDRTAAWCWRDADGPVIVAGAAVSTLAFDTLGRINDALVATLVMPFGVARRRFDKRAFRYVRLTHLGVRAGAERDFSRYLDSVLHAHGCHYAMLVIDPRRNLAQRLGLDRGRAALSVMGRWHGEPPTRSSGGPCGLHPVDL